MRETIVAVGQLVLRAFMVTYTPRKVITMHLLIVSRRGTGVWPGQGKFDKF